MSSVAMTQLHQGLLGDLESEDVIEVVFKATALRGLQALRAMIQDQQLVCDAELTIHQLLMSGSWQLHLGRDFRLRLGDYWQARDFATTLVLFDSLRVISRRRPLIDWLACTYHRPIRFRLRAEGLQYSAARLVELHQGAVIQLADLERWRRVSQTIGRSIIEPAVRSGSLELRSNDYQLREALMGQLELFRSLHQPHRD